MEKETFNWNKCAAESGHLPRNSFKQDVFEWRIWIHLKNTYTQELSAVRLLSKGDILHHEKWTGNPSGKFSFRASVEQEESPWKGFLAACDGPLCGGAGARRWLVVNRLIGCLEKETSAMLTRRSPGWDAVHILTWEGASDWLEKKRELKANAWYTTALWGIHEPLQGPTGTKLVF